MSIIINSSYATLLICWATRGTVQCQISELKGHYIHTSRSIGAGDAFVVAGP
jgi:hypothetical protein